MVCLPDDLSVEKKKKYRLKQKKQQARVGSKQEDKETQLGRDTRRARNDARINITNRI